jgi:NAD(P)-dependent dehydrogenase (short-subunit alcohol dehydrogenase family)
MATGDERFLVTGAAGCIGAWAVRVLLDDGVSVVASDLSEDPRRLRLASGGDPGSGSEFLSLDVTRLNDLVAAVEDYGITNIVHLAALQPRFCAANPPLGALVNVVGPSMFSRRSNVPGERSAWPTRARPSCTARATPTRRGWRGTARRLRRARIMACTGCQ